MNIQRFILVLLMLAGLGTALGAISGALLGAAVPQQVTLSGESSGDRTAMQEEQIGETSQGMVSLAAAADRQPYVVGAALGAGLGLMAGVAAGLCLAVVDQVLLAFRLHNGRDSR